MNMLSTEEEVAKRLDLFRRLDGQKPSISATSVASEVPAERSGKASLSEGVTRMKSELAEQVFALIEDRLASPTPMEFEMAYQARVAIDRIRFAIKHTEQFGPDTDQLRDASFQLLDALHRLETVDRKFQKRSQVARAANSSDGRNPSRGDVSARQSRSLREGNGRVSTD
jgi:hypothetical protein